VAGPKVSIHTLLTPLRLADEPTPSLQVANTYLLSTGLPKEDPDHATTMASFCCDLLALCCEIPDVGPVRARIGIHSGPVTAGIIGRSRRFYRVFGDTVNVASRMMSTGLAGCVQVSAAFAASIGGPCESAHAFSGSAVALPALPEAPSLQQQSFIMLPDSCLVLKLRGDTMIKGKGLMATYWLHAEDPIGTHSAEADASGTFRLDPAGDTVLGAGVGLPTVSPRQGSPALPSSGMSSSGSGEGHASESRRMGTRRVRSALQMLPGITAAKSLARTPTMYFQPRLQQYAVTPRPGSSAHTSRAESMSSPPLPNLIMSPRAPSGTSSSDVGKSRPRLAAVSSSAQLKTAELFVRSYVSKATGARKHVWYELGSSDTSDVQSAPQQHPPLLPGPRAADAAPSMQAVQPRPESEIVGPVVSGRGVRSWFEPPAPLVTTDLRGVKLPTTVVSSRSHRHRGGSVSDSPARSMVFHRSEDSRESPFSVPLHHQRRAASVAHDAVTTSYTPSAAAAKSPSHTAGRIASGSGAISTMSDESTVRRGAVGICFDDETDSGLPGLADESRPRVVRTDTLTEQQRARRPSLIHAPSSRGIGKPSDGIQAKSIQARITGAVALPLRVSSSLGGWAEDEGGNRPKVAVRRDLTPMSPTKDASPPDFGAARTASVASIATVLSPPPTIPAAAATTTVASSSVDVPAFNTSAHTTHPSWISRVSGSLTAAIFGTPFQDPDAEASLSHILLEQTVRGAYAVIYIRRDVAVALRSRDR
jgi:hypothetical protein